MLRQNAGSLLSQSHGCPPRSLSIPPRRFPNLARSSFRTSTPVGSLIGEKLVVQTYASESFGGKKLTVPCPYYGHLCPAGALSRLRSVLSWRLQPRRP